MCACVFASLKKVVFFFRCCMYVQRGVFLLYVHVHICSHTCTCIYSTPTLTQSLTLQLVRANCVKLYFSKASLKFILIIKCSWKCPPLAVETYGCWGVTSCHSSGHTHEVHQVTGHCFHLWQTQPHFGEDLC